MSSNKRMYADFHVIQTVPPSCVNRDDTGSPKTAVFGGATRARVSSQAWKHEMRKTFKDDNQSWRTKRVYELLCEELKRRDVSDDKVEALAINAIMAILQPKKEKEKKTREKASEEMDALLFISQKQIESLAALVAEHPDWEFRSGDSGQRKRANEVLKGEPSVDIALFGRMVASNSNLNADAAAQVAHAISTHAIHNEYDYFTAVDDCSSEDNAGAGHLGTVEFNSSTLYRYATVNVGELAKSLKTDTASAVRSFGDAFIRSMPTGKQNTFANRTRPDAVYVTIRGDQPVNLAGAFEKPIVAGQNGYVQNSVKALAQYAEDTYCDYVDKPRAAFSVSAEFEGAVRSSLPELLDSIERWIADHIDEVN